MNAEANAERTILVTGGTGQQGGAALRHLLDRGFPVRALTRDAGSSRATAVADRGAEPVQGDLEDRSSVERAVAGVWGVYSVQDFKQAGPEGELRQGKLLADVAKAAGVQHFVYSSVGGAERDSGIPHFESKWRIEQHVREVGLHHTILRPVFFMNNWFNLVGDAIRGGQLPQPLSPHTRLQQIAVDDIGAFAALAFSDPDRWNGRAIELAGDDPTMIRTAEALGESVGREVEYVQVPWEQMAQQMPEEMVKMYRWFEEAGYEADIPALRREYPDLKTLEQYLRSHEAV